MQDFRLGSSMPSSSKVAHEEQRKEEGAVSVNKSLLSIDYSSMFLALLRAI
jgi:hypothetical protein